MTTTKAVVSWIEISQSRPFHFNCVLNWLLNHTSVGVLQDGFSFEWFCLTYAIEICFYQESPQQLEISGALIQYVLLELPWNYICIQFEHCWIQDTKWGTIITLKITNTYLSLQSFVLSQADHWHRHTKTCGSEVTQIVVIQNDVTQNDVT